MSPERDSTEEPGDANVAQLAPSQLPVLGVWVSLVMVLGLLQAVRRAGGRAGQSLALSLLWIFPKNLVSPQQAFPKPWGAEHHRGNNNSAAGCQLTPSMPLHQENSLHGSPAEHDF